MSDQGQSAVQDQAPAPDNVGDDVRAAISELKVGATEPPLDVVIDKGEAGRQRDESGRFAAALKTEAASERKTLSLPNKELVTPAPLQPGETKTVSVGGGGGTAGVIADPAQAIGVESSKPVIEPPKGWSAEAKAQWDKVPEALQREAVRREEALTKQLFAHDEARDFGRKMQEAATPYLPTIRAEGATVEKAFENYLQTAHVLRQGTPTQKAMALQQIAQAFNVDLSQSHQQGGLDPRFAQLEQQNARLEQELQGLRQERQQDQNQGVLQTIADWAAKPGHEHFERVKTRMGRLSEDDPSLTLDQLYEQAIWSHPEIRTSLVEAQSRVAEEKRISEAKAKADAAKAAAVSVKGSPGGSRPLNGATSHGSIADDLRAAAAEIRGRV